MSLLLVGAALPAYAQHEEHEHHGGSPPAQHGPPEGMRGQPPAAPPHAPPQQPGPRAQPAPPHAPPHAPPPGRPGGEMRGQPPPAAPNRPEPRAAYAPPRRAPAEARTWHAQGGWRQGAWPQHSTWQEHKAQSWQSDHRSWAQRGGYGGAYIPADRYNRRFGDRHVFRMHERPVIYEGYPRFRYGGYSFLIVDPWPEAWGDEWYQSDDLYIDYEDGYYLHDRRDPNIAIAITMMP